ncbi:MAG: murein hydrolase activator EnvC [Eubacteriales bacterium]
MRKLKSPVKIKIAVSFILCVCMILSSTLLFVPNSYNALAQTSMDEDKQKIQSLQGDLQKLTDSLKKLSNEIAESKKKTSVQAAYKDSLDSEISLMTNKIETSEKLIVAYDEDIALKGTQIEEKQVELDESFELFCAIVRSSYEDGTTSYLDVLLGSENLGDLLSRVDMLGDLLEYNKNVMQTLADKKEKIESAKAELEANKIKVTELKAAMEADKVELEKKSNAAANVINELKAGTQEAINAYEKAAKAEDELQAELKRTILEMEAKDEKNKRVYSGGQLYWPMTGHNVYISSEYANRINPITGRREHHNGLDIAGVGGGSVIKNKPIYAAEDGEVILSKYNGGYGNCIVISHGSGLTTLYAHANKLLVKVGDTVKRGDTIALVGTTGMSTGYHLHFEISVNGERKNPRSYFPDLPF